MKPYLKKEIGNQSSKKYYQDINMENNQNQVDQQVIGILKVGIQLSKVDQMQKQEVPLQEEQFKQTNFNKTEQHQNTENINLKQKSNKTTVSFQILLGLSHIQMLNSDQNFNGKKIYCQYKVYGTQESLQTKIVEINLNNPYVNLENNLLIPCSQELIVKMKKVPLIVEVWQKNFESQDNFLGMLNVSLVQIPNSVLNKQNNYNENWCSQTNNSSMVVIVSNQYQQIHSLSNKNLIGQIFTTIVFGSVAQIQKFKQMNKQNQNTQTFNQSLNDRVPLTIKQDKQIDQVKQNQTNTIQQIAQQQQPNNNNTLNQQQDIKEKQKDNIIEQLIQQEEQQTEQQDIQQEQQDNQNSNNKNKSKQDNSYKQRISEEFQRLQIKQDELFQFDPDLVFLEVFECLKMNESKIRNRIREFINSLRPPDYTIKQFDLYNFLSKLPIKYPSQSNLIQFCHQFDYQNNSYFLSEYFSKSFSSYVFVEEQIRNQLKSSIISLRDVLHLNRITMMEFEKILNNSTQFGYCSVEQLDQTFNSLLISGLDKQLISNIISGLSRGKIFKLFILFIRDLDTLQILQFIEIFQKQEILIKQDSSDNELINVGQILDYLKQIETYQHVRNLYSPDPYLFRKQILKNLRKEISQNRIQIRTLSENQTQNYLDLKAFKDLFSSLNIELSYWECYNILKEILSLNNLDNKNQPLFNVSIKQINLFFQDLEKSIILEQNQQQQLTLQNQKLQNQQPQQSISENDSDIRDLNQFLNKSLMENKDRIIDNLQENTSQIPLKEEDFMVSYSIRISAASLNDMNIHENLDGKIVYIRYLLPLEEQNWIDSGIFEIYSNHENYYRIPLMGNHKIMIKNQEDLLNVFKDNQLKVEIRELSVETLIASTYFEITSLVELFGSKDTTQRIITLPLINDEDQQIGIINMKMELNKENIYQVSRQNEDVLQQKEQQVQKLFPKSGLLTANVSVENIEEEVFIELSIFKDDSYLNHLFKPFTFINKIEDQQYFITISKQILTCFQECQGIVRVLNKRGDTLIGEFEFDLIDILIKQQLVEKATILNLTNKQPFDIEVQLDYQKAINLQQKENPLSE